MAGQRGGSVMMRGRMIYGGGTLQNVLSSLGLTTNLKLSLDAGDAASYTSGQKWLDRSGNGHDFFRGADVTETTDDPTFNGTVGSPGSSTYFSLDGGDFFRYDTTNEAWMENLHKDNAIFTIVCFYYQPGGGGEIEILGTHGGSAADIGIGLESQATVNLSIGDGSGAFALDVTGDTAVADDAWHMVGVSLNEATGAGGGFLYLDGAYNQVSASDTFNSAYATPSSSNADFTMELGTEGNGATPSSSGSRLACIAIWEGTALSKANMDAIWVAMRGRFGL